MNKQLRVAFKSLVGFFTLLLAISLNTTNANAFAGTLENGNLAYAQSEFNKGEACNYLPGFESGYDAWHFVLTTRGATFQQDPKNPAIAINLNFVFMRQDGSLFTIKSGAWVQTGKGAYTYTPVQDKIRMVQAGSLALINGSDSGMRLSHTCPGTGSEVTPTPSSTPTTSSTPTASPSPTATKSATPTPTPASATPMPSPSVSATPTPSASASPSPSVTPTPTPSPSPSSTVIPTRGPRPNPTASAVQVHPTGTRSPLPTPSATPQGLEPTPTPSPSPSPTRTPTPSPTPSPTRTATSTPTPTASPSQEPTNAPIVVPTPPVVEDPKNVEFVEPKTPKYIDPQTFPEPPSSPVVITKEPTYGDIKANNDGTFTYTPPVVTPPTPVVDLVEFKYTNLSGEAVVVRKEFVLTAKGDVPSIIQTGDQPLNGTFTFGFTLLLILTAGFVLRTSRKLGANNA